jgi:hypothetical protein
VSGRARPPYDPWRDVDGVPISVGCRVEQVAVAKEHGAHSARLHKHGVVIRRGHRGRGHLRLYVCFEGEDAPVSIRPHLVQVVPEKLCPEFSVLPAKSSGE